MTEPQTQPEAPLKLDMFRGDRSELFIKQTKKGCIQELMGCEATNEFLIFNNKDESKTAPPIAYSLEESSFCMRLCCRNNRSFTQTVWEGTKDQNTGDSKGDVILTMERPLACPLQPCCLCNFAPFMQTIKFGDIGSAEVPCFFFVPAIKVKDKNSEIKYNVQMPTCMGGICVNCMAEGCCNCKIPFYIYPPGVDGSDGNQVGKIVKLWRGLGTEIFTDAASFQIEYPPDADQESKALLTGTTFFINTLFFEKGNE